MTFLLTIMGVLFTLSGNLTFSKEALVGVEEVDISLNGIWQYPHWHFHILPSSTIPVIGSLAWRAITASHKIFKT
jgi:hypothetical protein